MDLGQLNLQPSPKSGAETTRFSDDSHERMASRCRAAFGLRAIDRRSGHNQQNPTLGAPVTEPAGA